MNITIGDSQQLPTLLNTNRKLDFVFQFPLLNAADNVFWTEKIRHNYFACGCSTGKLFMKYAALATLTGMGLFCLFYQTLPSLAAGLYAVLFLFIMAGIGKSVGKLSAYHHLKKDILKLQSLLTLEPKSTSSLGLLV